MDQKFQIGDVVRLKSGGPNMTVAEYDLFGGSIEKKYLCRWFDDKHRQSESTFVEAELQLVHP